MGDRQARDECVLQVSVECASGQEETYGCVLWGSSELWA